VVLVFDRKKHTKNAPTGVTVNLWDGQNGMTFGSPSTMGNDEFGSSRSTNAIVTIHVAYSTDEYDNTVLIKAKARSIKDIRESLVRLNSGLIIEQREDPFSSFPMNAKQRSESLKPKYLQAAEIVWSPTIRTETLTDRDLSATYPELNQI
jgi:hypothetical protein